MSFFDQQVNLSQVEETSGDFSPIPPGEYTLEATGYKEKLSSNNNQMLELEFTIVGPSFGGRKIWDNFVKGQPVAYGRLKSWIVATGLSGDQDLNQPLINSAMNRRFQGNVYMQAGTNGYADKPQIKSFLKPQAAPAQQPAAYLALDGSNNLCGCPGLCTSIGVPEEYNPIVGALSSPTTLSPVHWSGNIASIN